MPNSFNVYSICNHQNQCFQHCTSSKCRISACSFLVPIVPIFPVPIVPSFLVPIVPASWCHIAEARGPTGSTHQIPTTRQRPWLTVLPFQKRFNRQETSWINLRGRGFPSSPSSQTSLASSRCRPGRLRYHPSASSLLEGGSSCTEEPLRQTSKK